MAEIKGEIEYPQKNSEIKSNLINLKGWTFSEKGDVELEIYVDDEKVGTAWTGIPRLDIEKQFSSEKGYESGFIHPLSLIKLENGNHSLKIIAKSNSVPKILGELNFHLKKINEPFDVLAVTGNFKKDGQALCDELLIKLGGIQPHHRILDMGCAMGRVAMPLTKYLNENGSYEGLDIVPEAINWCKNNITPKFPNFHFTVSDIFNKNYNRRGTFKASEYNFPFDSKYFDFVFLLSVFTHMLPKDMENYLSEISRILKKGGKCLITYYLLNEKSLELIKNNFESQPFKYEFGEFWVIDKIMPEYAVAYYEKNIRELFKKNGLRIIDPIKYGRWPGKSKLGGWGQEKILAEKM